MSGGLDISVLIATYNRAAMLRETLENMTRVDRDGVHVEFVVVDNNSSDDTKAVIESFACRLPLRHLFEPRPGKNVALNKALREVAMGELVLFTDDDVRPEADWFKAVIAASKRWPEHSLFGGRILPLWQGSEPPSWVRRLAEQGGGLPIHDHGDEERPFPQKAFPAGANLWVRRTVVVDQRFDEAFGPRPKKAIMGSETSFVKKLQALGYEAVYCPNVVVGHYFPPDSFTFAAVKQRMKRAGRTMPHLNGFTPRELYENHRAVWFLRRVGGLAKCLALYAASFVLPSRDVRILRRLSAIKGMAFNVESLVLACRVVGRRGSG